MSINTDVAPYFNDANTAINANYMEVLFKPGFAVQARELTQLQSLLQNQITQLGNFVLTDGSPVQGGHVSFDGTVVALQLEQQFNGTDINLSDFFVSGNNTLIINASGAKTVKAVIIGTDSSQNNPIIIIKYLTGTTFEDGDVIQVASGVQSQASLITSGASSPASVASINYGIFYSGGYFVTVAPSTIVLSSSNSAPSVRVGLQIQESIVDATSDATLLDPAQGSFNYQAPGADRHQYNLVLSYRDFSSTDDSAFYNLVTIENGLITSQVDYPLLGTINDTLAERSYDTNGDFTVNPFIITTGDNQSNSAEYQITVSPGKAFVKGYEFETVGAQKLYGDRALSTNTITDYSFSLEFGNILTVANVYSGSNTGFFNLGNFQAVDLHSVTSGNINSASTIAYTGTKIGTARVRDVEFAGFGNYYAYVLDVSLTPYTFSATSATGNTQTLAVPGIFANSAVNAFANVSVTVTTNNFIDNRKIIASNATIITLSAPLSTAAVVNSNVSLNFGIKDVNSLVIAPVALGNNYYTQQAANALCASMDIALAGKDASGNTVLADTQFNKLIYQLPQTYIAQGTITNANFGVRSSVLSQNFTTAGSNTTLDITTGSGQIFPYGGSSTQYLSDVTANTNFVVVVRNALSSNLSNGQILVMDRNFQGGSKGNGVIQDTTTRVTIFTNANGPFVGDVYYTTQQNTAQTLARRSKTLKGNTSNTTLATTDSYMNGSAVVGLTGNATNNVYVDAANAYVWFLNPATMATTPGGTQTLYLPDVTSVIKVYDSGNTSFMPNSTNAIDVTANYQLNSGQTDNYYDYASLTLKSGANAPTGQTVVMLTYFQHSTNPGFFDADSYSANAYSQGLIPFYNSQAFGSFALRDAIDFRPTRQLATANSVATLQLFGIELPQPDHVMTLTYQFYLPRIDKLLLNKGGQFQIKQGVPSQYPTTPGDSSDAMTLYVLSLPAFTANTKEITLQYVQNKRYTMKDIGTLDSRISQLEYYSTLTQLEQQAQAETLLYQDNVTAKDQYGILADDFGDFSIVDNQNTDLKAYLQQGTLSPFKLQTPLALVFNEAGGPIAENDKTYSLPFTEAPAIVQNNATTAVSVQPYLFAQFTGTIKLIPETDFWFSPTLTPQIIQPPAASPALPPLPVPVAAPALKPAVSPIAAPVVASSHTEIVTYWYEPYYYWWYGAFGYTRITAQIGHTAYGVISPINNWYGYLTSALKPAATKTTQVAAVGSSIQLGAGNKLASTRSPLDLKRL